MGWEARLAGSEPPGAKPLTTVAANLPGKTGSGFLSVVRNVFLLSTSFLSIASYQIPNGLAVAGSIMRSTFHLASSAAGGAAGAHAAASTPTTPPATPHRTWRRVTLNSFRLERCMPVSPFIGWLH